MENPIAIGLLRKADEIIKAKVTYITVDTPLSIYVFHRLRTIFLSTICPSAVILINGRSMYPKPYKTPFTATDMTNKVSNNSMPNNRKEIYLETRILTRLAGLMSSNDNGDSFRTGQMPQIIAQLTNPRRVKTVRRFIENQQGRPMQQRLGHS